MYKSLIVLLCWTLFTHSAFSENITRNRSQKYSLGSPSEFVFESYPNQDLIPIRLLGAVSKAGLYHVPKKMKLITLLSLAGGTTKDANLEEVIISNEYIKPKKSNNLSRSYKKTLTVNLEQRLLDESKQLHVLKANDIVLVKHKEPLVSTDTWRIISIVSVSLTGLLTALAIDDRL
jgi:hypothetical protein